MVLYSEPVEDLERAERVEGLHPVPG